MDSIVFADRSLSGHGPALKANEDQVEPASHQLLLKSLSGSKDCQHAFQVLEKLAQDQRQWQDYQQIQQQPFLCSSLTKDRQELVKQLEEMKIPFKLEFLFQQFKPLSTRVARLQRLAQKEQEDVDCLLMMIRLNQAILKELVVGDVENGTYQPQNEAVWEEFKHDNTILMEVPHPDTIVCSAEQESSYMETCDTCGWNIGCDDPRWRCMDCLEVQCQQCHDHFHETFHHKCGLEAVCETLHPSMKQRDAGACPNLAQAMYTILDASGDRPCVCPWDGEWMSYLHVLEAALQRVTLLRQEDNITLVILCFPAGSVSFYLWDIACILAGVTSIGVHVPIPPKEDWPTSASHLICEEEVLHGNRDGIPSNLIWINATVADGAEPFDAKEIFGQNKGDPKDAVRTLFLTSGTTSKPKLIPETRTKFLEDNFDPSTKNYHCTVSYLPHCWGTDRGTVYWVLTHGGRVGFAPSNPTLPEIVQAMERYKPIMMVLPPAVGQFLCSLPNDKKNGKPPSNLGGRLEYVSIGSGPVPQGMPLELSQKYGIRDVHEGYGITEVGGVASKGWFFPRVVNQVRLRDPHDPDKWLDKTEKGVVGELWIGDFNTCDIVELACSGQKVRVIGRSSNAASFKLPNGKWCALIDVEDEFNRTCCPDLFEEVMVWCNCNGVLVMVGSLRSPPSQIDNAALMREAIRRTSLSVEMRPKALLLTDKPLPRTITMKIQRGRIIKEFHEQADLVVPDNADEPIETGLASNRPALDVPTIAARILGRPVDTTKSFVENGGDSMAAIQLMQQVRKELGDAAVADWRSLLNDPLQGPLQAEEEIEDLTFEPPSEPDESAIYILLSGATGYLGGHVLNEILRTKPAAVVVCLVQKASKSKIKPSDHVMVITEVPSELKYRSVIHCAANVDHIKGYPALKADNVDLTADLLRRKLAPMIYCSTSSTQRGVAPFSDGYTQSKWVSEQMVLRSGGKCFWPPLLVWCNSRDWLMRLIKHCLRTGRYPAELGFVVACPVDVAARDLVAERPCSAWDLDLSELFMRLRIETGAQPMPLAAFVAELQTDTDSPAYRALPLLLAKERVGNQRTPSLDIFPIDWQSVWPLLRDM